MRIHSLKTKLMAVVAFLIIGSGFLISLMVAHRYERSLSQTTVLNARHLARQLALEATDKILLNDLVALQKMLDHYMQTNPSLSYLFIVHKGAVLAHSFTDSFPSELLEANQLSEENKTSQKVIASQTNKSFFDFAQPIFEGKAGTLRLGMSETIHQEALRRLWAQMLAMTLVILSAGLALSHLFIRRIIGPLSALAEAAGKIERGDLDCQVPFKADDEIGELTEAFNKMMSRLKLHTRRLEEKTNQLDRAYQQIRQSFEIVQDIGTQGNLREVCTYLIRRFQTIVGCRHMAMLTFHSNRNTIMISTGETATVLTRSEFETALAVVRDLEGLTFVRKSFLKPPLIPESFTNLKRMVIFPVRHEEEPIGALIVACAGNCQCDAKGLQLIELIFRQTSGAMRRALLQEEKYQNLLARIDRAVEFDGFVGRDTKIRRLLQQVEDIAPTDATVLIQGESGTGKELIAHAIHRRSHRRDYPFMVINCSAYPATLLESELFGHVKGAFTGAIRQKAGRFEQADGGTVFLDEIGEIEPAAQIKLLRVLQTRKFERLGGENSIEVDIRVIAATNRDLLSEVRNGNFREDLFYRLNVIQLNLPPLRDRRNDIPLLARHFLKQFAKEQNKTIHDFSPAAMRRLLEYSWPGNVRELENSVEHAAVLSKGDYIEMIDLPAEVRQHTKDIQSPTHRLRKETLIENEKNLLADMLAECSWNKKMAAKRLGISRSTLYDKIKRFQISKPTLH